MRREYCPFTQSFLPTVCGLARVPGTPGVAGVRRLVPRLDSGCKQAIALGSGRVELDWVVIGACGIEDGREQDRDAGHMPGDLLVSASAGGQ